VSVIEALQLLSQTGVGSQIHRGYAAEDGSLGYPQGHALGDPCDEGREPRGDRGATQVGLMARVPGRQGHRWRLQDGVRIGQGMGAAIAVPVEGGAAFECAPEPLRRETQSAAPVFPAIVFRQVVDRVIGRERFREQVSAHPPALSVPVREALPRLFRSPAATSYRDTVSSAVAAPASIAAHSTGVA